MEKKIGGEDAGVCLVFVNQYSSMHAAPPACLTMTYRWGYFGVILVVDESY